MALPTDWEMGKFLKWYTDLPVFNRPRTSPTFFIQNIECYFYFCRENEKKCYYVYLKPETACPKLEPFKIVIYCTSSMSVNYTKYEGDFSDSNKYIYYLDEYCLTNKIDFDYGLFLNFYFLIGNCDGPLLPFEVKKDEKFTQVDLMSSMEPDADYLSSDFGELLKSGNHSDVQLQCKGGDIPAHKVILAARSQAFSYMFKENTSESQSGLLNFATTDTSVMKLCLEYIYKGNISKLPTEMAPNLYVLGHDLKIPALTKMCADLMISNSSNDNYIPYLVLADKHKDKYFKFGLIDYISNNADLLKQ